MASENAFRCLKDLLITDESLPKENRTKIIGLRKTKDPDELIALLPESMKSNYEGVLNMLKENTELVILQYDSSLLLITE